MNTTGIVRRIDDLGRIVIPKEIRKTLRIKEGDPLEISIINDNILLKKYSSVEDFENMFNIFIAKINDIINKNILVFDRDKIICANGDLKLSNYKDKNISTNLYKMMEERKINCIGNSSLEVIEQDLIIDNYIFSSIITNGDVIGGVLIYSEKNDIDDQDKMFLSLIINIFVKYIEE